jgi:hypothetical protein
LARVGPAGRVILGGMEFPPLSRRTWFVLPAVVAIGLLWAPAAASARPAWKVTDLRLKESVIYGISCPSTNFCVGVGTGATPPEGLGSAGVIVSSRRPRGPASAWEVTPFPRNPHFTPQLRDVSCPTARLCVAVANKGTVLTSTKPMGGRSAWKVTRLPAGSLRKVSCSSASFCVIAGYYGKFFVTRHPTGGTGAWSPVQLDPSLGPTGISCPSTALCVTAGNSSIFASNRPTDPGSPWSVDSEFEILNTPSKGADCPSRQLCLVGGASGVFTSHQPATPGNYTLTSLPSAQTATTAVGCASPEACLAATEFGYVFSSREPAGGAAAWHRTRLPPAFDSSPFDLACATTSLCVISGRNGLIASSSAPLG